MDKNRIEGVVDRGEPAFSGKAPVAKGQAA
jgi:hypothetical protein